MDGFKTGPFLPHIVLCTSHWFILRSSVPFWGVDGVELKNSFAYKPSFWNLEAKISAFKKYKSLLNSFQWKDPKNSLAKFEQSRAHFAKRENRLCQVRVTPLFWDLTKFENIFLDTGKRYKKNLVNSSVNNGLKSNHAILEQKRAHFEETGQKRSRQVSVLQLFWDLTMCETLFLDAGQIHQTSAQQFAVWRSSEQSCQIWAKSVPFEQSENRFCK